MVESARYWQGDHVRECEDSRLQCDQPHGRTNQTMIGRASFGLGPGEGNGVREAERVGRSPVSGGICGLRQGQSYFRNQPAWC
jgi:hypothetical protein